MAGLTQKSSVAAFPVWSLQKQNGCVKRSKKKNMKDLIGCSLLPHWCVYIDEVLERKQGRQDFPLK